MQNNYLTDTHFHLTLTDYIPDILKRAKEKPSACVSKTNQLPQMIKTTPNTPNKVGISCRINIAIIIPTTDL